MKLYINFIVFWVLSTFPILLMGQDHNNVIGVGLHVDRLSYEKSLDGVRKDIDLGVDAKYLRNLFPVHPRDSIHYYNITDKKKLFSRYWVGVDFGLSGYYVNSDSVVIITTDVSLGPALRYYASNQLFIETSAVFQYSWAQIRAPDPLNPGSWYIPWEDYAGLKWQLGTGFSKRLVKNVFLEPMIGYRIYWRWYATHTDQRPYELYDVTHGFTFSLCFQFSF